MKKISLGLNLMFAIAIIVETVFLCRYYNFYEYFIRTETEKDLSYGVVYDYEFDTPNDDSDVIFAYYELNYYESSEKCYLISKDGYVACMDLEKYGESYGNIAFNVLNEDFKLCEEKIKIRALDQREISELKDLNISKKIEISKFITGVTGSPSNEKHYKIVQKDKKGDFDFHYLWKIRYSSTWEKEVLGELRCVAKDTTEFCAYIDYAVKEAKKAGL